jgi:hypothetical protein
MSLVSGTFLAVTFLPAILLGIFALYRSEQRAARRAVVARAVRRTPRRQDATFR